MVCKFHAIILSVLKFRWFSGYAKVVKNICSCKLFSIIIVNKKAFLYNFKFFVFIMCLPLYGLAYANIVHVQ